MVRAVAGAGAAARAAAGGGVAARAAADAATGGGAIAAAGAVRTAGTKGGAVSDAASGSGVASPAAEIKYTLLGAGLATLVVFATNQSADWIPLGQSLRFLIAGGLALTPFGLWTTLRVFRELKQP